MAFRSTVARDLRELSPNSIAEIGLPSKFRTRQQEFNYPQGQTNNLTSYEGNGGVLLGGFLRRILIAFERGDLAKLPFSDDINQQSRLLMRRNVRDRVAALVPLLSYDSDPYIVVGDHGRPHRYVQSCSDVPLAQPGPLNTSLEIPAAVWKMPM